MIGQTLSHYRVLEKLGEGGMGILYRARDTRLDRNVALKVLRPDALGDASRKRRLVQEARAASALNHPHIVVVHDIGEASVDGRDVDFIAMECVAGRSLSQLLADRRLGVGEALDVGLQIVEALAVAHAAGIVHRDIKPSNVMLSDAGQVKVLDFGLARVAAVHGAGSVDTTASEQTSPTKTAVSATQPGALIGTPAYMSPEQAEGKPADARSDVFALGAVLYEMLAARRPFQGDSQVSLFTAILRDSPPPLRSLRPEVPRDVQRLVARCLAKGPDDRYASAADLLPDLVECRARHRARASGWRAALRQRRIAVPLSFAILALASSLAWALVRNARERWARNVALPEIARLVAESGGESDNYEAYWLARQAAPYLPGDPQLDRFWKDRCYPMSLRTKPPGADVFVKSYATPEGEWKAMGQTPLEGVLVPYDMLRWRITKDGFEPLEVTSDPGPQRVREFTLDIRGAVPSGMVRVGGGRFQFRDHPPLELEDFWLDRHEVTNRQYKEFVDQGGYRNLEYWKQPFVKDGRSVSRQEAMASFVDATGQPGPATWEVGTYPDGEGDFPVGGVSWYEAAAYAAFVGKELPTFHHWFKALGPDRLVLYADIVHFSNFGGIGPAAVGSRGGMSPYGNLDMAGNVREWCSTEFRGQRYVLGGAWTDPAIVHLMENAESPWTRTPVNGFRCARYMAPLAPELKAAVATPVRDYSTERPVSDEVFQVYRSFYAYDRGELKPTVESIVEEPHWRREKVSFDAAYRGERVPTHLFLPRNAKPPYQTVVYIPTGEAYLLGSSDDIRMATFDYIVRSGRAVVYPIYQGTYERRFQKPRPGPREWRDAMIEKAKDLGRALDYLDSRHDVDRNRLALLGVSDNLCLIAPAFDERFKVTVAQGGGRLEPGMPPELDPFNFVPRVRVPALILKGRYDPWFDEEGSWRLFLKLLGTPVKDKRLVFVDSGHSVLRSRETIRETLGWLDRHLGPVETQ
jgi:tRNA A-37 threonylcarbamoyl transferase component Bud32